MAFFYDSEMTPGYFHSFGLIAGAAAFIGHCYPVWLKFKGGKGVATYVGLLLAAMWQAGLVVRRCLAADSPCLPHVIVRGARRATLVVPIFAWWLNPYGDDWIVFGVIAVLIYWRHRANIERLLAGTEPKIGSKKKPEAEGAAPPGQPH